MGIIYQFGFAWIVNQVVDESIGRKGQVTRPGGCVDVGEHAEGGGVDNKGESGE